MLGNLRNYGSTPSYFILDYSELVHKITVLVASYGHTAKLSLHEIFSYIPPIFTLHLSCERVNARKIKQIRNYT